ncbi:MAG TPA: pilus assembly protein [Myxococcales bacterium]|jgi:hypothetical protein|nr:pilus assembly protein [Myxococcales bacterium]
MAHQACESGQSAVETALTVPMMVFFVLGVIQLGMMHQAQLMTEYAAYRAARAGVVNHADCELMENAAFISLLPTLPPPAIGVGGSRADTLFNAGALYLQYRWIPLNRRFLTGLERVEVDIVNPTRNQLNGLFNTYGSHLQRKEIDWDDVRDEQVIRANLLTVRVTYNYQMRIPFADRLIHSWFMGINRLQDLKGIQFENQKAFGVMGSQTYLEGVGATRGGVFPQLAALAATGTYVIPLTATYSMRMQSNPFRQGMQSCVVN